MSEITLSIPEFKANCARMVELVARHRNVLVIVERGRRLAKVVPFDADRSSIHGFMKGTATNHGDIVAPMGERWTAEGD